MEASLSGLRGEASLRALNRIGAVYAFRPGARAVDLDSALAFLDEARRGGTGSPVLLSRTQSPDREKLAGKRGYGPGGGGLSARRSTSAVEAHDKHAEAIAWAWWGTYAVFQPATILSRIVRLKKADSIFNITGDRRNRIVTLSNIGYLQAAAGKMSDSQKFPSTPCWPWKILFILPTHTIH
ncbi:hypothetical protein ACQ86N_15355 [Puia sp. P3]|uniref:hypothetical protein n=1 Tax=Puia sp. P3 TaxID=3423952 RepID=UPI003D66C4D2